LIGKSPTFLQKINSKSKSPYNRPRRAQMGSRGIALLILDLGARRWWVVSTTLRPLYPRERPDTHCTGGWVGPQGLSGRVRKISPPPEFDSRTVQPVASQENKLLIHRLAMYPLWCYGMELWGCSINTIFMQRPQSIILTAITNAPRYVTNHPLHTDFYIPFVSDQ
jgi:hypothetical protein